MNKKLDLRSILKDESRTTLLAATEDGNLDVVKSVVHSSYFSPEDVSDALWILGYADKKNDDGIANLLYSVGGQVLDYNNGKLASAVEWQDLEDVQRLLELGADIFQNNHTLLYSPIMNDDFKLANYLMALGLSPKIAFTDDDMAELKEHDGGYLSKHALDWLSEVRESSVDDSGAVKNPGATNLDVKLFSKTIT